MDMSDTSMSGGMDMSSSGMFKGTNMHIARVYWYLVVSVVGLLGLRRFVEWRRRSWGHVLPHELDESELLILFRTAKTKNQPGAVPSRTGNYISQLYDATITIIREMSYPRPLVFHGRLSKYFTPPSLGKLLFLLVYWMIILICLWANVILKPSSPVYAYKWEIVGFRAAWVSVTQVPFIYCLSCRINIISIITGISYERLNWFHRWAARTLFLTVIVHWSFFFREWSIAKFVRLEIEMMPMVKYGFGAWSVTGWMVLSSFGFFRAWSYEVFVLQHLLAAAILLWLLHVHVPAYATYNVWLAIGFVVFDRLGRISLRLARNLHLLARTSTSGQYLGYPAILEDLGGEFVHMRIEEIPFAWRPGQHIFITLPSLRCIQSHPFTIANTASQIDARGHRAIDLYIRAHSGFTRDLLHEAKSGENSDRAGHIRTLVNGPWGCPPSTEGGENLILMATANGASFAVPIFEATAKTPGCLRRICFFWTVRSPNQLSWYRDQIVSAYRIGKDHGLQIQMRINITSKQYHSLNQPIMECLCCGRPSHETQELFSPIYGADFQESSTVSDSKNNNSHLTSEKVITEVQSLHSTSSSVSNTLTSEIQQKGCLCTMGERNIFSPGRPDLDGQIRPIVEDALGHTSIVACAGRSFTADLSNYVSRLSDERAIHKGTGAQGLSLYTEAYGW